MEQRNSLLLRNWAHFVPIFFKIIFAIFFKGSIKIQLKSRLFFYLDFSLFTQLYRVKYIKCLKTRKYSLEHKCKWNLSPVWLFLAIVTRYLNCLDRTVLTHPFWLLTTFPVCFSALSCWTNRASYTPSSSTFLHSCSRSWLFASDTHCSHGPASMSVEVPTISPSYYM